MEKNDDQLFYSENNISELINILRKRANKLRNNALISLLFIFISLFCGIYIFVYAIQLTEIKTFTKKSNEKYISKSKEAIDLENIKNDFNEEAMEKIESLSANQQFIAMIINKIGALIILFFMVKLLIVLYRYNTMLSAYFDSRADALHLLSKDNTINDLVDIIQVLSPEKIEFDSTPQLPIEQFISLLQSASSGLKK